MDPTRSKGSRTLSDLRIAAIPDVHGHAKGEHRPFAEERPIAYSARMLFLWFYHATKRGSPRFLMVSDHINYLTFEDPGAVNTVRRALKLAHAGDLYGAAETAGVEVAHAAAVSEGLKRGMRFSIGAEVDNDPRARPDAQNIVDAMRPDGLIRTVHFVNIDHPEKGADWSWAFDNDEFAQVYDLVGIDKLWELYAAKLFDDLEKLPAHIAGHFYVPSLNGQWPNLRALEGYEDRLLQICHSRGLAVEINTRPLYRDFSEQFKKEYIEANTRLARKAKALGVGIAIGSDAHSPKDQGNAFDIVLPMLDDAKINEIVFPVGGRLARVALRATREHLEAHAKTRETTSPGSSITGFSRAELGLPEEAEPARRETRATRDSAAKKRAAESARAGSRRTAESSSSSSRAKAARATDAPGKTPPPAKKAATAKAKPVVAAKPAKVVKPVKAVAKPVAPVKKAAAKAPAPAPKGKTAKAPPKPVKPAKVAPKKAAPAKAAVAKKPAPKKAVAKKPAAKPAAKPKKLAAKPAAKAPAKKAAKKPAKAPSKVSATKKKSAAKRR